MTTLKRVVQILEEIASNHNQINDFGTGDVFELNNVEKTPPILWVDIRGADIQPKTVTLNLHLYVASLYAQSDIDRLDTKSETLLIINDVITLLRNKYDILDEDFNFNATPFVQQFIHRMSGWYVEVDVEIEYIYGECDIPTPENL